MNRRVFKKALNRIESRSYESNISRLNDELKKTGMLSERMTTSTVLPPTETQPFIPPTTSDIPDTSGLLGNSFSQPSYGGNESDPSTWDTGWNSNAYLKNPDTLDGVANRPILALPDAPYPYDDGAGDSAIVTYGGFYGTSVGLITPDNKYRQILVGGLIGGTNRPTEQSRGFGGIYRGMSDEQFDYAVAFWNTYSQLDDKRAAGEIGTGSFKVWIQFNNHHHGGSYDAYSGVKSGGRILQTVTYFKQASTYTSDHGQPRTIVLNRLDNPSSPDYHEGDFTRYLKNLLDLSGQAFDYLDQKALETEKLIAGYGLRPDGTQGLNNPGDVNRGHDGTLYKLVPRPGYGYNMWVPLKKAQHMPTDAGDYTDQDDPILDGDFPDDPFDDSDFPDLDIPLAKGKKKKKTQVAHHELKGDVISEGWQSPDHTNVEKDSKTRWFNPNAGTDSAKWFDPKEVKPAYPTKAPPKMIDGYSADSNLAPKPVEKSPAIKLTKKDLLRNHKLKDGEVAGMMQTIARLNKFIADHPEELIYAKSRYPKHDPRLAELNWNMDQMLKASGDYLDKQFPENERLFDKVKSATKRSIDLTDPETYKKDPGDLSSIGNLARVDHVMNYYEPKDRTVSKIKMVNRKSVNRFFEKPKRPDRPAFLRKKK